MLRSVSLVTTGTISQKSTHSGKLQLGQNDQLSSGDILLVTFYVLV